MTKTKEKSTEIAPLRAELRTGSKVAPIVPTDIEQAYRIATAITAAGMAPDSYDRQSEKVLVGILHGLEVGLTPMAALQSIAVINGRPSIWGDGALGLVLGSGLVEDFDEHYLTDGKDAKSAVCIIKRKGWKTPIRGQFSMEDAAKAKLLGKKGPWQDYPDRMLKMRARGFALRDGFADVLRGLHIAEEMTDMGPAPDNTARPVRANYEDAVSEQPDPRGDREEQGEDVMDADLVDADVETEEPEPEQPTEINETEPEDPAAPYRVDVNRKPDGSGDWIDYRARVIKLAKDLGPDSIPHIEAANAGALEEMSKKSKGHFDDMWRVLGGMAE